MTNKFIIHTHNYFVNKNNIIPISYIFSFLVFYMFQSFFKGEEYLTPEQFLKASNIGNDLKLTIQMALNNDIIVYSPLVDLGFRVFDVSNFKITYRVYFIFIILLTLIYSFKIIPKLINISKSYSLLFIIILWISYGFEFELERGQWNIISYIFVLISYVLYKKNKKLPAYFIFALSVHLKVYPLIFIFLFLHGISDIKVIIKELLKFSFFIVILFFVQGYNNFIVYINQLIEYSKTAEVCFQNHSISSYAGLISQELNITNQDSIQISLFVVYILILAHTLIKSFNSKINIGDLLMILTIGSMIIPSVSYDYKISLLWLSMPIYYFTINEKLKMTDNLILIFIFILFFSTQFSYTNYYYLKQPLLYNKFIQLFGILIFVYIRTLNFKNLKDDSQTS